MDANIYLEAHFWGSVLNARLYAEGQEITVWFNHPTKKNTKFRNLPGYPVDGDIDIMIETWGKRGSHVELTVKVDNTTVKTIRCVNNPGYGVERVSIPHQEFIV